MPKTYDFSTLAKVLDALNDGRRISLDEVRPSLHGARLHVGMTGCGAGYMPDPDSHFYARNLRAVVDSHCDSCRYADESGRAPNGFRRSLLAGCGAYSRDGRTFYEVSTVTVSDAVR